MDVRLPDGRIIKNVPEGTTKAELNRKLGLAEQPTPVAEPEPQTTIAGTAATQALQGATFGFADEISDSIGALIAGGLSEDLTIGEAFKQARELTQITNEAQLKQHPLTAIAANLAGSIATGGVIGATKSGKAITEALKTGGTALRGLKAAGIGGITGAAFGAGTAGEGERIEAAKTGLAIGAAAGAVAPAIGQAVTKTGGFVKRTANKLLGREEIIPNSDALRKQAGRLFQEARQKGGGLTEEFVDDFAERAKQITPQTRAGKLLAGDDRATQIVKRIETLKGKALNFDEIQETDEFIGDLIEQQVQPNGRLDKLGKKFLDLQSTFREMIEGADESVVIGGREGFKTLNNARKLWSKSAKLADIERIIERADLSDNPATVIKSGFRNLASNPKRIKSFSKPEREAIKKAAQSGVVGDLLRTAGSRLIPIITASSGGGLGGTAAAQAGSLAARGASTATQVGKAREVARLVAGGATPAQANPLLSIIGTEAAIQGR